MPSRCRDSNDRTWSHRWHQGCQCSGFGSIRLAAPPLETLDPVVKAGATTASDGALDGKGKLLTAAGEKRR